MDQDFTGETLAAFAGELAAKRPVPGGGGAAAYAGALAASLCAMVARYTTGKKAAAPHEEELARIVSSMDALSERLVALVDKDAQDYAALSAAFKLDKADPARTQTIQARLEAAAQTPLLVMECVAEAVQTLERLEAIGTPSLLSDVGCGAALAAGALDAARMTVYVNTASMTDRALAARLDAKVAALAEVAATARTVSDRVAARLANKE
jgi:formiminotetrahydrofolate cyclodeaminase